MRLKRFALCGVLLLPLLYVLLTARPVSAETEPAYRNPDTGYEVYIDDAEGLIDGQSLLEAMKPVTAYGGAAFVSASPKETSDVYAEKRYRSYFGNGSGTLFLIDMENRYLWIFSDGDIYKVVTRSYADTITDNVYRKATAGKYTDCAVSAFEQITVLLQDGKIAQPMKHISNVLLALLTGLGLNFLLMATASRKTKPSLTELSLAGGWHAGVYNKKKELKSESKMYLPKSDRSGSSSDSGGSWSSGGGGGGWSSGGGGGFSGGGGGSSSSGGGGGHRF